VLQINDRALRVIKGLFVMKYETLSPIDLGRYRPAVFQFDCGRALADRGVPVVTRKKIRMDWKECAAVETVPGRVSGAPVIKGSRVRPDDLVVNRAEGEAWLAENFDLPVERVRDVLSFYDRHKPAP